MTLDEIQTSPWRLFDAVSGSRAYGTDTPESDIDIRGVFVLPPEQFYGFSPPVQVSDATNDITFYELGRFIDLLTKNNPNVVELIGTPKDCIHHQHPLWERLEPRLFLSKRCRDTFAGYAMGQIRKARGLNKKIVNPFPKERRTTQDFCHVMEGQGSMPLKDWLAERAIKPEDCGLVSIPHMRDVYGIYHDPTEMGEYRGIFADSEASEVRCSSVAQEAQPIGWMAFNKDGFKKYCREYQSYWDWVEHRNEARYATNIEHGRNYDSKNLMHTFRLLDMAEEIAREGEIRVRRPNRDELMRIRQGEFEYEDLVDQAEAKVTKIDALFEKSPLPNEPDRDAIERLLVDIRQAFYKNG
ncbi:MAG: hypothetical protein ACI8T1_004367 [Verrucomicrobiales bacterium]|jgi:hypothetical protein